MPIRNGKDVLLTENSGTLPDMSDVIIDYFQPMIFKQITKSIVAFKVVEVANVISTSGCIQFNQVRTQFHKEGQQKWLSATLYCLPEVVLNNDDQIEYRGKKYRVVAKGDYSLHNFLEYYLTEDFTGSDPS